MVHIRYVIEGFETKEGNDPTSSVSWIPHLIAFVDILGFTKTSKQDPDKAKQDTDFLRRKVTPFCVIKSSNGREHLAYDQLRLIDPETGILYVCTTTLCAWAKRYSSQS